MTDHTTASPLVEVIRGDFIESVHFGHAVVADASGQVIAAWGDPDAIILPRSSCKMIQALPLIESGAADALGLTAEHLALSCASHQGAEIHRARVSRWLGDLGMSDDDLRCGPQIPNDATERHRLRDAGEHACQLHNNCSGKHSGFLSLKSHIGGNAEYVEPSHPVQIAVCAAFEEMTGETSPGYGIDGCSAPNFACSIAGLARAAARMAQPSGLGASREQAAERLVAAMMAHPELVAGEGRACTALMRALPGVAAVKTGAEGVFVGILPGKGWGIAVKISDGATRAAELAISALLVQAGVADPADPEIARYLSPRVLNRRDIDTGYMRRHAGFAAELL
ncbi:MAG: asparaginase [Pseudomonadota bacterium]